MNRAMLRMFAVFFVSGALLLATATPGEAFMTLKGGFFIPNSDSPGLDGFDNGFGGELGFGADMGLFALEGGLGYYRTSPEGGGDALQIVPATATAKLLIRPTDALTLYVGGGIGYYVAFSKDSFEEGEDNSFKGVGFHAVGGVWIPMGGNALVVEGKWSQADVSHDDFPGDINVGGITILAGLKF